MLVLLNATLLWADPACWLFGYNVLFFVVIKFLFKVYIYSTIYVYCINISSVKHLNFLIELISTATLRESRHSPPHRTALTVNET